MNHSTRTIHVLTKINKSINQKLYDIFYSTCAILCPWRFALCLNIRVDVLYYPHHNKLANYQRILEKFKWPFIGDLLGEQSLFKRNRKQEVSSFISKLVVNTNK